VSRKRNINFCAAPKEGFAFEGANGRPHEFKWSKVKRQKLAFYRAVVNYFFERPWLSFQCLVVQRATVDRERHKDHDEARRKHFTMLLANKAKRALKRHPSRTEFRVWVDPIASYYAKADEAVQVIGNNILAKVRPKPGAELKVTTHRSHETPSIQFCDLLLGAVMSAWQGNVESEGKLALQKHIAAHLDWPDLKADTHVVERKFNIWYFYDPTQRPREVASRKTKWYPSQRR
jgi:hypothetical protein